jgi:hypothetical protein
MAPASIQPADDERDVVRCFLPVESDSFRWHTDLPAVFAPIAGCVEVLTWLLIDPEAYPIGVDDHGLPPELFTEERIQWIPGSRLAEILKAPPYQLIWGRLLGFPARRVSRIDPYAIPGPEPYIGLRPTDPSAVLEVVAFDCTSTEIFARDPRLAEILATSFPERSLTSRS